MEIAIAAAVGAAFSAVTGGDPLEGALIGGITGGLGGAGAGSTFTGRIGGLTGVPGGSSLFSSLSLGNVLLAGGGILSASSAIQQGNAAEDQANQQAEIENQRALRARQLGAIEAQDFRKRSSAQDASFFNARPNRSLLVATDFQRESELQALRIENNAEVGATRLDQSAFLGRVTGQNKKRVSRTQAAGSLLSSAAAFA
jgi:hypothetical protein